MAFICWLRIIRALLSFGVFIAEEVDGVGDEESQDTSDTRV
jgi:hypothetical protein